MMKHNKGLAQMTHAELEAHEKELWDKYERLGKGYERDLILFDVGKVREYMRKMEHYNAATPDELADAVCNSAERRTIDALEQGREIHCAGCGKPLKCGDAYEWFEESRDKTRRAVCVVCQEFMFLYEEHGVMYIAINDIKHHSMKAVE
jgi:hypothetical protein